jgi:hypothetical protein
VQSCFETIKAARHLDFCQELLKKKGCVFCARVLQVLCSQSPNQTGNEMSCKQTSNIDVAGVAGVATYTIDGGADLFGWSKQGDFSAPGPVISVTRVSHRGDGHSNIHFTPGETRCVWNAGAHSCVEVHTAWAVAYRK